MSKGADKSVRTEREISFLLTKLIMAVWMLSAKAVK
jgi:hypothetical protein